MSNTYLSPLAKTLDMSINFFSIQFEGKKDEVIESVYINGTKNTKPESLLLHFNDRDFFSEGLPYKKGVFLTQMPKSGNVTGKIKSVDIKGSLEDKLMGFYQPLTTLAKEILEGDDIDFLCKTIGDSTTVLFCLSYNLETNKTVFTFRNKDKKTKEISKVLWHITVDTDTYDITVKDYNEQKTADVDKSLLALLDNSKSTAKQVQDKLLDTTKRITQLKLN